MGCGGSSEKAANQAIERELAKAKKDRKKEIRLLLLGTGESGKSTIVKQMKILHKNGYTKKEVNLYKTIVARNVIEIMTQLVKGLDKLEVQVEGETEKLIANLFGESQRFPGDQPDWDAFKQIYADPSVSSLLGRRAEFQLNDSAAYFMDKIDALHAPGYEPSTMDILMCRVRTTGISETQFNMGELTFTIVDVGGQRNERKKWIHQFEDVTGIVFVVALSEYDLMLFEDDTVNRMHESLRVWEEVCNNKYFKNTAMILFLNKTDLFKAKLAKSPITAAFPEYSGPNTFEGTSKYITDQFLKRNHSPQRQIYRHFTTATNSRNIDVVFISVKDVLTHQSLAEIGMI